MSAGPEAGPAPDPQARLDAEAEAAAVRAGVRVRGLRADEMHAAAALFEQVWQTDAHAVPMEPGLLVALGHAGNYCVGAFDATDALVGACVGFFGVPLGQVLHSHIAAVRPGAAGPGTGTAMKRHQRAWCGRRGLASVAWTYDPLIARNAWFNLGRLGARPRDYLVDFYGEMPDGLNAGQGSDRVLVHWAVPPDPEPPAPAPDAGPGPAVLAVGRDDEPEPHGPPSAGARRCTLGVPRDIEALRARDPALGARWRSALREAWLGLVDDGWRVAGFTRDGRYEMERT